MPEKDGTKSELYDMDGKPIEEGFYSKFHLGLYYISKTFERWIFENYADPSRIISLDSTISGLFAKVDPKKLLMDLTSKIEFIEKKCPELKRPGDYDLK